MAFIITSTGTVTTIEFEDLGGRTFQHPVTGFDLESEFTSEEIRESLDLQNAINNGWITVTDSSGNPISSLDSFDDTKALWGQISGDIADQPDLLAAISNNMKYFDAYNTTQVISQSTTWLAVPLNNQRIADDIFNHSESTDNSEVTVTEDDIYVILGRVGAEGTSSNSRTQAEARIEISTNGGTSWSAIPGTTSELYLRQTNFGATGPMWATLSLTAGTKIRLTFRRESGGGRVTLQANGSALTILRIKGVKGDKGEAGVGSSITVQGDGITLSNGSTSSINFNGLLSTTDNGNGSVTITGNAQSITSIRDGLDALSNTNFLTDAEKVKLSGVEDNATADQISTEVPFSPVATGNWNAPTVNNVGAALDEVADRLTQQENSFGSNESDEDVSAEFTTSSTTLQPRANLNAGILPAGRYRVGWYYERNHSDRFTGINVRVQVDNTTTLSEALQLSPYFGTDIDGDYWYSETGFGYITFGSTGTHNVSLDFSSEMNGIGVSIRNVKLEIWKIS